MTCIVFDDMPEQIIQKYKTSIGQPSMTDDEALTHACQSGARIVPNNDISLSCYTTPREIHPEGEPTVTRINGDEMLKLLSEVK